MAGKVRNKFLDLKGNRYKRLLVTGKRHIKRIPKGAKIVSRIYWECVCDCGVTRYFRMDALNSGQAGSCGCLGKENRAKGCTRVTTTHGMTNTRFYKTFCKIVSRTNNSTRADYKYYAGKGIMCLWTRFEDFRDDMYESYLEHVKQFGEKETTIDRIDNNGHYCKDNCRWATYKTQSNNRDYVKQYEYAGEKLNLSDWAEKFKTSTASLYRRFNKGMTFEEIAKSYLSR